MRFFHVILHGFCILIGRDKNNFDALLLGLSVPFLQFRSESSAWRTPMCREVEANKLLGLNHSFRGDFGVVSLDEMLTFE
eukprot:12938.XXX_215332_215571_1 [CDS] Oithona nana genome sequencing.